ncbi:MAG TPA: hypothetical protein VG010_07615 [Solirubrobacteraceae bacterium]|jgi:hypothetical protein|nr:hypothetical protein [Solirubrobacteraceae bacterium]
MATSSRRSRRTAALIAAALVSGVAAAIAVASAPSGRSGARASAGAQGGGRGAPTDAFSQLAARPAPGGWVSATIASGTATLFYPPGWKPIPGDRGTVTASLRDNAGRYRGYLNVTPRQGEEQLAGWAAFRTGRNRSEGDANVRLVASAENLSIAGARASCVIDDYLSRVGAHPYRELACILAGPRATNVFVGAALLSDWPTLGPVIDRSASALVEL